MFSSFLLRTFRIAAGFPLLASCHPTPEPADASESLAIGTRLELLLDDYLIESRRNVEFDVHQPRPAEKVMTFEAPWEGPFCDYFTVFEDKGVFRMYYATHPQAGFASDTDQFTCYAESTDGIHWTKPWLGVVQFQGSGNNNIINRGWTAHNFSPFIDTKPGTPADERYKAVGGHARIGGLKVFASRDGLHWRLLAKEARITKGSYPEPVGFDSQNIAFWDPRRESYFAYFRVKHNGKRAIGISSSKDFLHWSDPELVRVEAPSQEHLYTNATLPYFRAPHLYLAFPMRYAPGHPSSIPDTKSACDAVLMSSRDGRNFKQHSSEPFLWPGPEKENWTKHSNMPAWGLLATSETELSVYYTQHFYLRTAHLRRGTLRIDRFVSLHAPLSGGEWTSKPLQFSGDDLVLNFRTSAVGSIRVAILDRDRQPLDGFGLEQFPEIYGDEIARTVSWGNGGANLAKLKGHTVRLRFVMEDADLFSIQFREAQAGGS